MARRTKDIEEQLRRAILSSDCTRYRLAKMTGITQAQLSLFVHRHRTLTLTTAAKLAKLFGLELLRPSDER